MGKSQPLPDPFWSEGASICIGCGYSLDGLAAPGSCPECGVGFEAKQLVLAGIVRSASGGRWWRTLLWVTFGILAYIHSVTWVFQVAFSWAFFLFNTIVIVGGIIAMVKTGKRERSGTERLVISPGGIARLPMAFEPGGERLDSVLVGWGRADGVVLDRVSPVWKRLRVGRWEGRRLREVVIDAGVRCPDAMDDMVRRTIEIYLSGAPVIPPPIPSIPPTGAVRGAEAGGP